VTTKKRRRSRPPTDGDFPSPTKLVLELRTAERDLGRIIRGYHRLHRMSLEPRAAGEQLRVSGSANVKSDGSVTGYPPEVAIESKYHEARRSYARWVIGEVRLAAEILARIALELDENVGPTAGYRQPETIGTDAVVSFDEFVEARENQATRLKAGIE
jgi:hypothetical protein